MPKATDLFIILFIFKLHLLQALAIYVRLSKLKLFGTEITIS